MSILNCLNLLLSQLAFLWFLAFDAIYTEEHLSFSFDACISRSSTFLLSFAHRRPRHSTLLSCSHYSHTRESISVSFACFWFWFWSLAAVSAEGRKNSERCDFLLPPPTNCFGLGENHNLYLYNYLGICLCIIFWFPPIFIIFPKLQKYQFSSKMNNALFFTCFRNNPLK